MKFRIEPVIGIVAVLAIVSVPRTMAQEPASDESREGERVAAIERKPCQIAPTPPTAKTQEGLDELARWGMFKSAEQIIEDLNHLKALADHLSNIGNEPDLSVIAKSASEIREAAARLRSKLALPKSESNAALKEIELQVDRPQLKLSISALSVLIANTVRTVMMQDDAIDVTGRAQLRSDLDAIVELSSRIKMQSELLNKDEQ